VLLTLFFDRKNVAMLLPAAMNLVVISSTSGSDRNLQAHSGLRTKLTLVSDMTGTQADMTAASGS